MMKLSLPFVLVGASLLGWSDIAAAADSQPLSSVGSVSAKLRPRAFNPFAAKKTRLKMNRFGVFVAVPEGELYDSAALVKASNTATAVPVVAPITSVGAAAAAAAPLAVPVAVPANVATAFTASSGGSVNASEMSDLSIATGAVRDPYRPPVRSPFRPPPRPPF